MSNPISIGLKFYNTNFLVCGEYVSSKDSDSSKEAFTIHSVSVHESGGSIVDVTTMMQHACFQIIGLANTPAQARRAYDILAERCIATLKKREP